MNINGIPAEEAHRFRPEQWVNVWLLEFDSNEVSYYCCSQVWKLDQAIEEHDISEFVLEPVKGFTGHIGQSYRTKLLFGNTEAVSLSTMSR